MKKLHYSMLATLAISAWATSADAALIAAYEFNGNPDYTVSSVLSGASALSAVPNAALNATVPNTSPGFSTNTPDVSARSFFVRTNVTPTGTTIGNNYIEFPVRPGAGNQMTLSSIDFFVAATGVNTTNSGGTPISANYFVTTKNDNWTATVGTPVTATGLGTGTTVWSASRVSISLASLPVITDSAFTLRLYFADNFNTVGGDGSSVADNFGSGFTGVVRIDSVQVNGSITAIPEPTTLAALGGVGLLALRRRSR
jgi:hypothetical protein